MTHNPPHSALAAGRWSFEMKSTLPGGRHVSRAEAWNRCRKAGLRVGIPEHWWCRSRSASDPSSYKWITRKTDHIQPPTMTTHGWQRRDS